MELSVIWQETVVESVLVQTVICFVVGVVAIGIVPTLGPLGGLTGVSVLLLWMNLFASFFPAENLCVAVPLFMFSLVHSDLYALLNFGISPSVEMALVVGLKAGLGYIFWIFYPKQLGFSLLLGKKYIPPGVKYCMLLLQVQYSKLCNKVYCPTPISKIFGLFVTLSSELSLLTSFRSLVSLTGKLILHGEDFFRWSREDKESKAPKTVVVFIHGNRVNEVNFLAFNQFLETRIASDPEVSDDFMCIAVNYVLGNNLSQYAPDQNSALSLVNTCMDQIKAQCTAFDISIPDTEFILVGHSLGGVISAYINEFFALKEEMSIKSVITVSAPLLGVWLLEYEWIAERESELNPLIKDLKATKDFLYELRTSLNSSQEKSKYMCFSGYIDLLVRPKSALPCFFPKKRKVLFNTLGHYSIVLTPIFFEPLYQAIKKGLD
eukprot:snap_masked-scaffold_4-processed-gene-16.46-mRNA-1 protein AED:1.00 eAED:1.00 QI:0/-1/0/0/-1/1/1/0/434